MSLAELGQIVYMTTRLDSTLRPQRGGVPVALVPVMTDKSTWPGVTTGVRVDCSTLCVSVRAPSGL
jgi:hypothetical protein